MFWSVDRVSEPFNGVIGVYVFGMLGKELESLGPECLDGFGGVVNVDDEAVGFVIILHITENVIVNIAEKATGNIVISITTRLHKKTIVGKV